MKKIAVSIIFILMSSLLLENNVLANDTIRVTLLGNGNMIFHVTAPNTKSFSIDWGDGSSIETQIGTGSDQIINHVYATANTYSMSIFGNSSDCLFTALDCQMKGATLVDINGCAAMETLICNNNNLTNLNLPPTLRELNCSNNQLTNLNAVTSLEVLNCSNNLLTTLDLTGYPQLRNLTCNNNQLTHLDLNNCDNIEIVWCANNLLTSISLKESTPLQKLYCPNNFIANLSLSQCVTLEELSCDNNQLTQVDVSGCVNLTALTCIFNQLTDLKITGCSALRILQCGYNQLIDLDLSTNTNLHILNCQDNQLINLDVSTNENLGVIFCEYNRLTNIDLSRCSSLSTLWCSYNELTTLDISVNTSLQILACHYNKLDTIIFGNNLALVGFSCEYNRIKLSGLYHISEALRTHSTLSLGTQILSPQVGMVGDDFDYSSQRIFNGINTVFQVETNGSSAPANTYTITNGSITFHQNGNYRLNMTNDAIVSDSTCPAMVSCDFYIGTTLTNLAVSPGTLNPDFSPTVFNYTVDVDSNVASIALTVTSSDPNATITGGGTHQVNFGSNTFVVSVNSPGGATVNYTVTVNRAFSTDAKLADLGVSVGVLTPTFNSSTYDYTVNVPTSVNSIILFASPNDPFATVSGAGEMSLVASTTIFTITVTATDNVTTQDYTVTVNRSNNISEITDKEMGITIYPNPTSSVFNIKIANEITPEVKLYDLHGRLLQYLRSTEVDMSSYPAGIYFLQIDGRVVKGIKK